MDAFISHVAACRHEAHALRMELLQWGIYAFVAHDEIRPTAKWEEEILDHLRGAELVLALLSSGFKRSSWCSQEIGAALVCKVPCVVIDLGGRPFGFMASKQVYKPRRPLSWRAVAADIVDIRLEEESSWAHSHHMLEALIDEFRDSSKLAMTEKLLSRIEQFARGGRQLEGLTQKSVCLQNRFVKRNRKLQRRVAEAFRDADLRTIAAPAPARHTTAD